MRAFEGSASIADAGGKLLFYTDGVSVWNYTHQVMENGTGLMGDSSSTQSAIIVPQPGSKLIYYIFTVDNVGGPDGLRYSVVDMNRNNNLGAIVSKNNLLATPVTEKITAVKHDNNKDVWVIAHAWNSDAFYAYLVTESGIANAHKPVISNVGTVHSGSLTNAIGYLKASPDGRKLALGIRQMSTYELFDFDNYSGIISNVTTFKSASYNSPYGVEFSPDGSKLYFNSTLNPSAKIYQIDLLNNNAVTLISSSKSPYAGALQLGPDGRIYFARYESITKGGNKYLGVIQHPNLPGTACTYTDDGLYLGGRTSLFGLPAFIQSYLHKPAFTFTNTCFGNPTLFHLTDSASAEKVQWRFDDPVAGLYAMSTEIHPSYRFTVPGVHEVSVMVWYKDGTSHKASQTIHIKPGVSVNLGKDTVVCAGQSLLLDAHLAGATYLWQDGSKQANITVNKPGIYWVDVTLNECITRDSIQVHYLDEPVINLGSDTTLCEGSLLKLSAPDKAIAYHWQDGSTRNNFTVNKAGLYWVEVSTPCLKYKDSIQVSYTSPPVVDFAREIIYTATDGPLTLNAAQDLSNATYRWQDGSTEAQLSIQGQGIYWVEVTNPCGTVRDSVLVKDMVVPPEPECISREMPNVITPNGDGANDTFIIPCMQGQQWEIIIYNRWGKVVYQNSAYNGEWQARDLANGTYFYSLTGKFFKTTLKGIIHVLR